MKGDKIDVPITVVATEALPTGRVISTYQGYEELQQVDGSLKIIGGSIPRTSRQPSPMTLLPVLTADATTIQYAQSVIQQFYNYINQRDYPAAYSLWASTGKGEPPLRLAYPCAWARPSVWTLWVFSSTTV